MQDTVVLLCLIVVTLDLHQKQTSLIASIIIYGQSWQLVGVADF